MITVTAKQYATFNGFSVGCARRHLAIMLRVAESVTRRTVLAERPGWQTPDFHYEYDVDPVKFHTKFYGSDVATLERPYYWRTMDDYLDEVRRKP